MRRTGYLRRYRGVTGPVFGKTSGPFWPGYYLTNGEQPHSLIVAPTRAGKGVGIVIPTLLTFKGSVIALDVKGELLSSPRGRANRRRRRVQIRAAGFGAAHKLLQSAVGSYSAAATAAIHRGPPLGRKPDYGQGEGAEGFVSGARDIFVAGILACIERGTPTIGAVYDLFAQPGRSLSSSRDSPWRPGTKRHNAYSTTWRGTTRKS